jgi:hypothetical protein
MVHAVDVPVYRRRRHQLKGLIVMEKITTTRGTWKNYDTGEIVEQDLMVEWLRDGLMSGNDPVTFVIRDAYTVGTVVRGEYVDTYDFVTDYSCQYCGKASGH